MAINLSKGQRLDIGLQKLRVGLGWDPAKAGQPFDLDLSAFMLDVSQLAPADGFVVFYNNPASPDGAVVYSGDDRSGGKSDGDDEILTVDLNSVDPRVEQVIFTVTIYDYKARKQNFGQVRKSFIRICDAVAGTEICKFELDEDFSVETAIEFGRLYKRGGAWRFEAMGHASQGGLQTFVDKYTTGGADIG